MRRAKERIEGNPEVANGSCDLVEVAEAGIFYKDRQESELVKSTRAARNLTILTRLPLAPLPAQAARDSFLPCGVAPYRPSFLGLSPCPALDSHGAGGRLAPFDFPTLSWTSPNFPLYLYRATTAAHFLSSTSLNAHLASLWVLHDAVCATELHQPHHRHAEPHPMTAWRLLGSR